MSANSVWTTFALADLSAADFPELVNLPPCIFTDDQSHPDYNVQFRQFIHVSFKIAAKLGSRYTDALKRMGG